MFGWFPQLLLDQPRFPLEQEDVQLLVEMHSNLTEERLQELRMHIGDFSLPDPDVFKSNVDMLRNAEIAADINRGEVVQEKLKLLQDAALEALEATASSLRIVEEAATRADHVLGGLANEILKDLLIGHKEPWSTLAKEAATLLEKAEERWVQLGTVRVVLPSDIDHMTMLADAKRRLKHFEQGGHRGILFLRSQAVRETRYVEERSRVDDQPPRDIGALGLLVAFLELEALVGDLTNLWPTPLSNERGGLRRSASAVGDLTNELKMLLEGFEKLGSDSFPCVPEAYRIALAERGKRGEWLHAINAQVAAVNAREAEKPLDAWLHEIQVCDATGQAHPCLSRLAISIESRDIAGWEAAWEERERIRYGKERLSRYQETVAKIQQTCPALAELLHDRLGDCTLNHDLQELGKAWMWASASGWLRQVSDPNTYSDLMQSSHRLQEQIERKTEELAVQRAWQAFLARLDVATVQNLTAWTKATDRIGKGTGKYAYRHRKTAREYLMACMPSMPAWVMPLHKLWDAIDAKPGLFDTIIIDEASQAGNDSLVLFLLAKRILVVGDDKQNSPEGIGRSEDDIALLAREHLAGFRFRDEFRPDTSLFDHAVRGLGNVISLREHFRCVPEIIRFSNDLCYTDARLDPLRQGPPNGLPPLEASFVPTGACEGKGNGIHNRAEALALVEAIQLCVNDEAYEGKTMGVIVLQGHAQANLIATMLAEQLDPQVIEDRRLRCGVPATFQGDQRDVIFLSMVTAPNIRSRALVRLPAQRRFNVAMSRARDQVWLFHSVQQHDLSSDCLRHRLLTFFQNPRHETLVQLDEERDRLERETRRLPHRKGEQPEPYGSWFEVDVALELLRKGYSIRPQFEIAGKRIDLIVQDDDSRLAVECDGDYWHGPEEYDRDIARQRQLERADLIFERVLERDFYADRQSAVQQIINVCKELGIRPANQLVKMETCEKGEPEAVKQQAAHSGGAHLASEPVSADTPPAEEIADSGPFTGYSSLDVFPDPREASGANVRAALRQIIERDGPLKRASTCRLYVEGCPHVQKVGRVVRQCLNRELAAMLRSGEVVEEDEFDNGSLDERVVRLAENPRVRERLAGGRDLLEIPASELNLILARIATASGTVGDNDEDVLRRLLEHYGFRRLTKVRRPYLDRVLQLHRGMMSCTNSSATSEKSNDLHNGSK